MNNRFRWTLLSLCLPHISWQMLNTMYGVAAFPMLSGFLRGWTMMSSTSLVLCLLLLFRYMLNLYFLLSSFLFVRTHSMGNCNMGDLLLASPSILHISLGWSMLMTWMALLGSVSCLVILMSWAILSLPTLEQWVLSSLCSSFLFFFFFLYAKFLCLFQSLTFPSLNCSPLSKSMRSWCGWSGILS